MRVFGALARLSRVTTAWLAGLALLLMFWVDVVTGSDVRVLSLYALPMA
jgi:hypothetical protein